MASPQAVRFASFNASLNRSAEGELITDLSTPDNAQAQNVAEIIQRTNPDVVLINEFDYDASGTAAELFQQNYLGVSQNGVDPVEYPYVYVAPSNTGIPAGFDFNNNGTIGGPDDAFGFGFFPGQFGMVLYSKYPIATDNVRTFQTFLWKDMPGALLPDDPTTPAPNDWYSPEELEVFRLSSKSHWDIPIEVNGETIHVLASHPTPPTFDGAEDRNGKRNHDEIRFWADYVTPGQGDYIYDDAGATGGLEPGSRFVIMGDQNADPFDGDSFDNAIRQLTSNPLVNNSATPDSEGGVDASDRQHAINDTHIGNPAFDTADFNDNPAPGNLRVDYVLPSYNLNVEESAVFWTTDEDALFRLIGDFNRDVPPTGFPASDHRLVWADVSVPADVDRRTVSGLDFLGEATFPTGFTFADTAVGGLSSLAYDAENQVYYAISDDRSQFNPARFYTLDIDLSDADFEASDVSFEDVTTLLDANGNPFAPFSLDPEGIALTAEGTLYISSEGDANAGVNPFVNEFTLDGEQIGELPVPAKFLPTPTSGIRNNLAFESLTIAPDGRYLYTATENALLQDGPAADLENESPSRILKYDLTTGEAVGEFVYFTDPVTVPSVPADAFSTNGLVELLAIDNTGTLLSLERSFSSGVGNSIKLYEVRLQGTTDISSIDSLAGLEVDGVAQKRLLLDFDQLGIRLDNIEGMTLGEVLPDGRQSLVIVSDNNFSPTQETQFLTFAIDLGTIPSATPVVETPPVIDLDEPPNDGQPGDADDPAIYIHPTDVEQSFVVGTLKDGGLSVYDLDGAILQTILPGEPGEVRYNNVDLVYGFQLGETKVDVAIASDRENDTLAIFQIDPATRQLIDITSDSITESIFGIDDGEQTAYGLATYTSPVTGKSYVFVSQREGDQVAQLELSDDGAGGVTAEVVRTLTVPIPADGELEDAQVEGMVADRELGYLYVGQENGGIFKFLAEPDGDTAGTLIEAVKPDGSILEADVEGLTIYYADSGTGYLLVSSQGDSTYAVFTREGDNEYLGSFAISGMGDIDGAEESDGADVINVPIGDRYPFGLLVVQDGFDDPTVVAIDEEEVEGISSNFKFVPWQNVANAFPDFLKVDTTSYNPRTSSSATTLPNGVASGDTTQDSTVLWTRSTVLGEVTFEYSTDADFGSIAGTATATVIDPLQPVKVQITGLDADTNYYYRVTDAAGVRLGGRFSTAAEVGTRTGLRFGVTGDWQQAPPFPSLSNADERDLEFFLKLGDTIYADTETPALPGVTQARTLEEFRIKQGENAGDRFGLNTLADLYRSTSILATIDDHEVVDNFAGGAAPGESPDAPDIGSSPLPLFTDPVDFVNDTQAYEDALQAFQEYHPIRDEFYSTADPRTNGERKLYRSNTYGNDAAMFVLDTRSFRDAQLAPADLSNPVPFLVETFNPDRTLLGDAQLESLKADLLEAEQTGVTWKFIAVPEPIQNFGVLNAEDRFEGYAAERTELLKFIDDSGIDNVVFFAGDFHGTLINNLNYQLAPGGEQISSGAFEIVTGPAAFFDGLFGAAVVNIATTAGLITPEQRAFYDALPVAPDADSLPNDKDDFVKQLLIAQTEAFGYDPIGLDNSDIDATLLQGDYVSAHTYGWTEVDIDPVTQKLTVTTYGIPAYSEAQLLANPGAIASLTPAIVSQFEVDPQFLNDIEGTAGADNLEGSNGDDRLNGLAGDDTIAGGLGNDALTGGGDNDTFAIGGEDGIDTITDFGGVRRNGRRTASTIREVDVLKFEGAGLTAENLLLTQDGSSLIVSFEGADQPQVILQNVQLQDFDNLRDSGNVLFDGQTGLQDSFDVFDAESRRTGVFKRNTVTFLNDLDNAVRGYARSQDVINAQGGNDRIEGFSGDDILRGGAGDDILLGGKGNDVLVGGAGSDRFVVAVDQGTDTVTDFTIGEDRLRIVDVTEAEVSIVQGSGSTLVQVADQTIAILTGVQASSLSSGDFIFG